VHTTVNNTSKPITKYFIFFIPVIRIVWLWSINVYSLLYSPAPALRRKIIRTYTVENGYKKKKLLSSNSKLPQRSGGGVCSGKKRRTYYVLSVYLLYLHFIVIWTSRSRRRRRQKKEIKFNDNKLLMFENRFRTSRRTISLHPGPYPYGSAAGGCEWIFLGRRTRWWYI